ncbi:dead end protein homolog 1 isoform X3 [Cuculus canorus]|uniref:dead end protein homolog 1 isoform X3 n=1 Tax=Cuculus canorus TaxID=55661 RepID=UPI0023AA2379|nr:dead end protein homolog 1 isoform X3 [Cuculus canorus]
MLVGMWLRFLLAFGSKRCGARSSRSGSCPIPLPRPEEREGKGKGRCCRDLRGGAASWNFPELWGARSGDGGGGWVGAPPPSGTEVFIGKLPQDVYENVLIPLFQRVGKLYEFRLMMTFSGLNRGFAYAKYSNQRGAKEAIATFNNFQVREGCAIVVCKSTEKCELSVDGLTESVSRRELEAMLRRVTDGILSVTLHASPCKRRAQLAVLKYSSHQAAATAKKALVEGNTRLSGMGVKVEWLNPDLKHKLQSNKEKLSPGGAHGHKCLGIPKVVPPSPVPPTALDRLNTLCRRQYLGTPLFLTKCVQVGHNGWLRFWCRVVIPGCSLPFTAFIWVRQDGPGGSREEEVKVAVALQVLQMLGSVSSLGSCPWPPLDSLQQLPVPSHGIGWDGDEVSLVEDFGP